MSLELAKTAPVVELAPSPLLQVRHLSMRFGGLLAVDGVIVSPNGPGWRIAGGLAGSIADTSATIVREDQRA